MVYKARDPVLDRFVALKLLHPHLAERADSRARFAREAKTVAQLKHANILEVFDYAPAESTRSYIVTEFVDGPTLKDYINETPLMSPEAAVIFLQPIADALTRAHDAGVVHRDVKPENIMLRPDGSPVLMDFGIAQMIDMPTLTATGTILGSPAHMAPEVIDGSEVGAKADVFSFGTVLYWAIAGKLPFTGPNPSALFRRILETDFDELGLHSQTAGHQLELLVSECLAKDPKQRPSARHVSARLTQHLNQLELKDFGMLRKKLVLHRSDAEQNLVKTVVSTLITQSEASLAKGKVADALDCLNRILGHVPDHGVAERLLSQVHSRQSRRRWVLALSLGLLFSVSGAFGYQWVAPITNQDAPQNESTLRSVNLDSGITTSVAPSAVEPKVDSGQLETVSASNRSVDQGLDLDNRFPLTKGEDDKRESVSKTDKVKMSTKRVTGRNLPNRRVKSTSVVKRSQQPSVAGSAKKGTDLTTVDAQSAAETDTIPVRFRVNSVYLAARVVVDGDTSENKNIFSVQQAGGLPLTIGEHVVKILSDGCKPDVHRVKVKKNQRGGALNHECRFLNASLRIMSEGQPLEIRDKSDPRRRLLGSTNQSISLPMNQLKMSKTLLIRRSDDTFETIEVELNAGKSTMKQLK